VAETRKLAAILVSDVVGYSRLTGTDEDRILARLRTLRSDLIDQARPKNRCVTGSRRNSSISAELAARGFVNERGAPFNPRSIGAILVRSAS
jgi:hypothetical protein